MASISRFISGRIRREYGRDSELIHPPVDTDRFAGRRAPEDYYLIVSALVPYKNVDVAVEAFRGLPDRRLVVAGSGPLLERLRSGAPNNVEFRGWVADEALPDLVGRCRAFLFPNVEDFGIAPVEAMAAGRPVIALAEGGSLDTVIDPTRVEPALPGEPGDGSFRFGGLRRPSSAMPFSGAHVGSGATSITAAATGLLFDEPTAAGLADAVRRFETFESRFDPSAIAEHARRFDRSVFLERIRGWIESLGHADRIDRKAA
jgi:glycosyltransferase involved in cell wall biosynthesis